tara:strand:+ start:510 stop:728 length:219 start_codon:yes stop_codon:yes gene_type:complete
MIDHFVAYMTIGLIFTFLVEVLIDWLIRIDALTEYSKDDWGWSERILCIWIWPIAILVLIDGYIKGLNNKNK